MPGCGIYTQISVNADENADFSGYRTFAWLHDEVDTMNSPYNNEIIRNNIRNYFGQSFAGRGYLVNLDTPDILLQVVVVNKKKERELYYPPHPRPYYYCSYYYCSPYYSPYAFDYYYRYPERYHYTPGYHKEIIQYMEGSITLNVTDRRKNKLIWTGTAKGDIYDPAYIKRDIHPAVLRIMRKFPVKTVDNKTKSTLKDEVSLLQHKK